MRWLALVAALILLATPVLAQEDGFTETFDDPALPGWELDHARSQDGVLMLEQGGAFRAGNWTDFGLAARARPVGPGDPIAIAYRVSGAGAYMLFVGDDRVALYRGNADASRLIDSAEIDRSNDWRQVGIRVVGDLHEICVDGQFALLAVDPNPLPPGGIRLGEERARSTAQFDDLALVTGVDIPSLSPAAQDIVALMDIAADPALALDEVVLSEAGPTLDTLDGGHLFRDTSRLEIIVYRYTLPTVAGAYNFVAIVRYPNPDWAATRFEQRCEEAECGVFHNLSACWGRSTYIDSGKHHRDQWWFAWRYGDRIFVVNQEYASLYPGEARDPMPGAELLYATAVKHGLLRAP